MKKLVCLLAVLILAASCAMAEGIDLDAMTLPELQALRDRVNVEIAARCAPEEGEVIFENEQARIVYLSWSESRDSWTRSLVVNLEWTNLSDRDSSVYRYFGYEVYVDGVRTIPTSVSGVTDQIRPGVTHAIGIRIPLNSNSREVEVSITNGYFTTYTTIIADLR